MRRFGAVLAISTVLLASGCGGRSRPSADDISNALRKGQDSVLGPASASLTKKAADCVGKVFVDSKLSDGALKAIVAGDKAYQAYKPSKADTGAINALAAKIFACVTPGAGG